jgi:hypothetical protein
MAVEARQVQRLAHLAVEAVVVAERLRVPVRHQPPERLVGRHLYQAPLQQATQLTSAAAAVQPLMPDQAISAVAAADPERRLQQPTTADRRRYHQAEAAAAVQSLAAMRRVTAAQAVTPDGLQQQQAAADLQDRHQRAETARMATAPSAVRVVAVARAMTLLLATLAATGAFPVEAVEAAAAG